MFNQDDNARAVGSTKYPDLPPIATEVLDKMELASEAHVMSGLRTVLTACAPECEVCHLFISDPPVLVSTDARISYIERFSVRRDFRYLQIGTDPLRSPSHAPRSFKQHDKHRGSLLVSAGWCCGFFKRGVVPTLQVDWMDDLAFYKK